jgi:hypothetical protein
MVYRDRFVRHTLLVPSSRGVRASLSTESTMAFSIRRLPFAAALLTVSVVATRDASAQALPDAKEIITRYGQAVGGDAWKQHRSAKMTARLELPAQGMTATIEAMNVFPTHYVMKMEIPGMGSIQSGFDGTNAWMKDPMMGPRLLEGLEAEQVAEEAEPEAALRTSAKILSSETVEKTSMGGNECFKVKHTWKSGRVTHDCFATSDGLLVATTAKQTSAMGEMEVTTLHSEYKDFGGIKRPSVTTAQMMGQEMKTTILSWEWDTVEAKDLEPPADVKALIKK